MIFEALSDSWYKQNIEKNCCGTRKRTNHKLIIFNYFSVRSFSSSKRVKNWMPSLHNILTSHIKQPPVFVRDFWYSLNTKQIQLLRASLTFTNYVKLSDQPMNQEFFRYFPKVSSASTAEILSFFNVVLKLCVVFAVWCCVRIKTTMPPTWLLKARSI